MKTLVIALAGLLVCSFAQAADDNDTLVKIGGKGKVAFVNTCEAPTDALDASLKKLSEILMIDLVIQKGGWTLADAQKNFDSAGANTAIFIVKDKTLPMSLIAMESKWGVVNAEGLDATSISKEALRVATVLLGGASSRYTASTMRGVFSKEDLQKKAGEIVTFDSIMSIVNYLPSLGIEQFQMMTKADAIESGLLKDDKKPAAK